MWVAVGPPNEHPYRCDAFSGSAARKNRREARSGAEAMARMRILNLIISERAESKMHDHGISADQLREMLDNPYVVNRNRKNRVAEYAPIGRDDSGLCIAAPILPTDDPTVWRPVTAWKCKRSELVRPGARTQRRRYGTTRSGVHNRPTTR